MRKIRVLHIVQDDKFVDGPLNAFESDGRFENRVFLVVDSLDYKIKKIKDASRVMLINNKRMLKTLLNNSDYDAIFFYSLPNYKVFNYIPKDKIVVWWAWGYDIYGPDRFINIPLLKPKTQEIYKLAKNTCSHRIKEKLKKIPLMYRLRYGNKYKAIRRVDYFQPVIRTEYELMQGIPGFKAKEFYYPKCMDWAASLPTYSTNHQGNILVGNSASHTNNHVDVWEAIRLCIPSSSNVIFPINYGDEEYAEYLTKNIKSESSNICFLTDYLPKEEYFRLVDSCDYAVMGVLRQQAMGNIYRCMAMGIKLFLYRDSVVYKYLKNLGSVVFAIEDINEESFKTPLSREEALINKKCMDSYADFVKNVRESAIQEIYNLVNNY